MTDPISTDFTPAELAEYRRRQKARARVLGLVLGALAVLFFFITIAKMNH